MHTPSARSGTSLLVVILLLISILLEQAMAGIFPWLSQVGGVKPMIVFLDIPLGPPMTIDWLPVGFIFIMFYSVVSHSRDDENEHNGGTFCRGWAVLGHWWLLLIFVLIGGGIYNGISGFLPKAVRNGIESFGIRADVVLPYPSGETVHLQGSMIMLAFFILGWRLMIRRAVPPAAPQPVEEPVPVRPLVTLPKPIIAAPPPPPIPAEAAIPGRGRIAMRIPEPIEVKSPGGRPCIYVSMPAGFQRKRISYPCVVENGIRPKANIS